ncbi:MAG TPA: hypothetical protein VHQ02_10075 [Usitatibacter sp.]|jgi:hypothetical protein|nr:hypothetical protein [Usitatibacter sp.]
MRSWIAGVTVAIGMATPLAAGAQDCDPQALLASCAHAVPADASFLDLASRPAAPALVPASQSAATGAVTQPAVYTGAAAPVLSPAVDTPLAGAAVPGWLAIPAPAPAPDFAWLLALGFLGLIVLRRTRAARAF